MPMLANVLLRTRARTAPRRSDRSQRVADRRAEEPEHQRRRHHARSQEPLRADRKRAGDEITLKKFWIQPQVVVAATGASPGGTTMETLLGQTWQRFSWHLAAGAWRAGVSDLRDFLRCIIGRFERRDLEVAMLIRIEESNWAEVTAHLLARDDVETAAILLAEAIETERGTVLAVRSWTAIPDDGYQIRRIDQIRIDPIAINRLVRPARDHVFRSSRSTRTRWRSRLVLSSRRCG
jgi:hypothetical protein